MNTHHNPYLPEVAEPASSPDSPPSSIPTSSPSSLPTSTSWSLPTSASSSLPSSASSSPVSTPASSVLDLPKEALRSPHDLPVFDKDSLTNPSEPILYLPPFLSSLPPAHVDSASPAATGRVPKATESHLPDIDGPSLALHKALHNFTPITEKYATTSYAEAFNWGDLDLPEEDEHEWYCVAFRSIRKAGSENGLLYEADRAAHEEAVQNGGLIMYWYGIPDPETGVNLATCVWQSRAHAIAANSRPNHIRAMRLAASSYETYEMQRWTLRKTTGSRLLDVLPYNQSTAGR